MTPAARPLTMPYPGLRPFEEEDQQLFFGREEQVSALLRQLEDQPFVAVVGSSGCGKSSLIRAGLLPAIREGFLMGTTDWLILTVRPGRRPYERLAGAIAAVAAKDGGALPGLAADGGDRPDEARIVTGLRSSDRGLLTTLAGIPGRPDRRVMVVVDQFEELFAFRRASDATEEVASRDEAAAFVRMLLRSGADPQSPVRVVVTMRSDFIGDCEAFLDLPETVSRSQFLVPRLDRGQMEEVIRRPGEIEEAEFRPFTFEEGLVNRIINEAGDRLDQLPLMQHALMQTWKIADRRAKATGAAVCITNTDYDEAGGIKDALSRHADAAWREIERDAHRARIARRLFLLLCDVSPDGQITRRRPRVAEVESVAGATAEAIEEVIRVFQKDDRNFLLPAAGRRLASTDVLDICHESLIRQWKRFKDWVEDESLSIATFNRLRYAALRWPAQEPLLRDPALTVALSWQEEQCPSPSWAERYGGGLERVLEYLKESQAERDRERDAAERSREQALHESRRREAEQAANARRFRNATAAVSLLSLAAVSAVSYAYWQQREVAAISRSLNELEQKRREMVDELEEVRSRREKERADLDREIAALRENEAAQRSKQQRLEKSNATLAAIGAARGTVSPSDDGGVAVDFRGSSASLDSVLPLLSQLHPIRSLSFNRTGITNSGIASLRELVELRSLDLSETAVGDEGIAHLAALPQLTELFASDTLITNASLPEIQKLAQLKMLDLSRTRIDGGSVDVLREKLSGCDILYNPDPLLDALALSKGDWEPALRAARGDLFQNTITFENSTITDSALKPLAEFGGLKEIRFKNCQRITNDGLKYLAKVPGLRAVTLSDCGQLSDSGLEYFVDSKVDSVTLRDFPISDGGMRVFARMPELKRLEISYTSRFTDEGVEALAPLTKLEYLCISFNRQLTDRSVAVISKLQELNTLELVSTEGVSGMSVAGLRELPKLRKFEFRYNDKLLDADLKHFEGLRQLQTLDLSNCRTLTGAGVESLQKAMPETNVIWRNSSSPVIRLSPQ